MEDLDRLTAALADRYQIVREIGEGGMATVFLAKDLKHRREVAVKVLKPELAAVVGAKRFLAEIETTANLIHPHILPLHDSGEADGFLFFVMPFVKGESLRDRLDREQQLPVSEAVRIATDLGEALNYAHRNGVIHRDIKPANVLIHEGRPLIADFGIALAVGSASGTRLTESGLSLGTPYYMSPEQATGDQNVGPASDIFALGCMLYEMLVGEPPYPGATAQAVLGKIISGGPVFATDQRPSIPPNVDAAIRKSLEKLAADRFQSGRGFARALADPTFRHGERKETSPGPWRGIALGAAAVAVLSTIALVWSLSGPKPEGPPKWISVFFPEDQALLGGFDISADGSFMVYAGPGETNADTVLWLRRWASRHATRLPNSRTRYPPAISPDGTRVAFFDGEAIRIIPLDPFHGVSPSILGGRGVQSGVFRWSRDGESIYFVDNIGMMLHRASVSGGEAELVVDFPSANSEWWLFFDLLPSGKGGLVEIADRETSWIYALDLETNETTRLFEGQFPRYADGHLFYVTQDSTLMKVPFDQGRMTRAGEAVAVDNGILVSRSEWWYYAVSDAGTVLYATGSLPELEAEFVWVTRDGEITPIDPGFTFNPGYDNRGLSLNSDGSRLTYSALAPDGLEDVYVKDLPHSAPMNLTARPGRDFRPRWNPTDDSVSFIATTDDLLRRAAFTVAATGTGGPVEIFRHSTDLYEVVYSPVEDYLVLRSGAGPDLNRRDLLGFRPGEGSGPDSLVVTRYNERAVSVSPNGRYLLFESDESGPTEVYVQPLSGGGRQVPVSTNGGVMPLWSHAGDEIFFVDAERNMTAARIETDPTFRVLDYETLFRVPDEIFFSFYEWYTLYDLAPDDERFVMIRILDPNEAEIELIVLEE